MIDRTPSSRLFDERSPDKTASSDTDSEPVVRDSTGATETPYALQLRSIPMKNSSSRMRRALISERQELRQLRCDKTLQQHTVAGHVASFGVYEEKIGEWGVNEIQTHVRDQLVPVRVVLHVAA